MSHRGSKRHHSHAFKHTGATKEVKSTIPSDSEICKAFEIYRDELDSKHDKYERLVKISRDLTIVSKRMIFLLHRQHSSIDDTDLKKELNKKLEECGCHLKAIVAEVTSEDMNKFHRAFSPGLQEFVEAISFLQFQTDGSIMTYEDVCKSYLSTDKPDTETNLILTPMDYILGIGDLTGELMRMCVNYIGAGEHEQAYTLCNVLRTVYDSMIVFHVPGGEFGRKLTTLRNSLKKVENACYQLHVRGSEVPKHMLLDLALGNDTSTGDDFAI